jgi:hypothetical protein
VQLYFFFNLCARWRWEVNVTTRPLYPGIVVVAVVVVVVKISEGFLEGP